MKNIFEVKVRNKSYMLNENCRLMIRQEIVQLEGLLGYSLTPPENGDRKNSQQNVLLYLALLDTLQIWVSWCQTVAYTRKFCTLMGTAKLI